MAKASLSDQLTLPLDLASARTAVDTSRDGAQSEPVVVDPAPVRIGGQRYHARRLLGAGGMGEVILTTDDWLGRDVAMKVMRGSSGPGSDGRARFLREARVQGQLEHPSIVPVYDLAVTDGGAPYFTMKRVQGHTLRQVLDDLRRGSKEGAAFGRRRLVSAVAQASLAVAFAHAHGVIHRDLKPENIMLGEFGEVYVLDWGIAKTGLADEPHLPEPPDADPTSPDEIATAAGSLIGTPGYMSPEQARGQGHAVTPGTDVYSMGAILFEILTLEPMHHGSSVVALLASTLARGGFSPSERAPSRSVPPELDVLVVRATALDPDERLSSMRELAESIERYLDGERDVERRKALAADHLARAQHELEAALGGGADASARRGEGLRELGRALALDPSQRAVELLSNAILKVSADLPPEAAAELKRVELADRARSLTGALRVYLFWGLAGATLMWMGVRDWASALLIDASVVASVAHTYWMVRTGKTEPRFMRVGIVVNFVVVALVGCVFGPLFFTPALAIMVAATYLVSLRANAATRAFITVAALASVLVPLSLEWTGVLARSTVIEDGVLKVLPRVVDFPAGPTQFALVASALSTILSSTLLVGRAVDALVRAERHNFAQAHALRQLIPAEAVTREILASAPASLGQGCRTA
jgi:serine/threonine-protein kinase